MPLILPLASALLPLLAQVGPFTPPGAAGTPLPEPVTRPARPQRAAPPPLPVPAATGAANGSGRLQDCLASVDDSVLDAAEAAEDWITVAKGHEAAEAGLCLGVARSRGEDWSGAEQAFLTALGAAGSDRLLRVRLGAMAGNAALAAGAPQRALTALDTAQGEAAGLADPALSGSIALDRARALVALKRPAEAAAALDSARTSLPTDADAWLLSATLARRQGQLAQAQSQIERAAELRPIDPAIGLEAGVIAMLAGRPDAARKSWQSVVAMAPDSETAATARGYLAQLGTPASPGSTPAAKPPSTQRPVAAPARP